MGVIGKLLTSTTTGVGTLNVVGENVMGCVEMSEKGKIKHSVMSTLEYEGVKYSVSVSGKGIRLTRKIYGRKIYLTYDVRDFHTLFENKKIEIEDLAERMENGDD